MADILRAYSLLTHVRSDDMFERYAERESSITATLNKYSIQNIDDAMLFYGKCGIDVDKIVNDIQPFACDDARYAFKIIVAIACKNNLSTIQELSMCIGEVLQSFCIDGSIAQKRNIGIGHGQLVEKLLDERMTNFAFVAGHESFAAADGALAIAKYANKIRTNHLEVVILGLGKTAADIIARYKGFNYIKTSFDYQTNSLNVVKEISYSGREKATVLCFGANSVAEGVAILKYKKIELMMTGNSTSNVKFTDPTVAIYKKEISIQGGKVFSVASGGGTGRTMHPDNVQAGPASYGLTDTLGRTHSDVQFAGSSSVPSHVQMVGFVGIGNNPLVGLSIVTISQLLSKK